MRITNSMLVDHLMLNLNTNLTKLDKLEGQLASGRKFEHISDDPVALVYGQAARNRLTRLSHYQRTVDTAQNWLSSVENGMMDLQGRVTDVYEQVVYAATDVNTDSDRQNIAALIGQLKDHYLNTLNATFGDKFMYAGYNTTGEAADGNQAVTGPFAFDEEFGKLTYNGQNLSGTELNDILKKLKGDVLTFDVGVGVSMEVSVSGIDLILFKGMDGKDYNIFDQLHTVYKVAMEGSYTKIVQKENEFGIPQYDPSNGEPLYETKTFTSDDLNALIKPLQDAQNHLLTQIAQVGGKTRRLELLSARYETDELNYTQMLSDAEDVDMAEVIMNQKMAESVYQAALSAGARIIQPTLMDFLR